MKWLLHLLVMLAIPLLCQSQDCGTPLKPADKRVFDEALELYNRRDYKESAIKMRKVAGKNPRAADPQFWLGMTAVKDGFNATAIRRYFGRCVELCPDYPHPLAHYYMGVVHYTDDRYDEAAAELERYFDLASGSTDRAVTAVYEEASNYLHWSKFLAEATLNTAPFDPQRVAGVSSKHDEMLPFLTLDGREMYYLRLLPEPKAPTVYHSEMERKHWRLCCSRWQDTTFSKGAELPPPFNSGDPEGGVSITADGNELYYSVIRTVDGYSNSDIYCVRRVDGRWQQPEALGTQVNTPRSWESQPTVSADGRTLLFASNRQGGQGGIDLWRCHRLANGDWSRAENLGTNINTAGNEKFPFLAADGRTLYFLSDGWQGFGGYDAYFADLADQYGNRPTNLGLPINSEGDELSFGVTADGHQAYFCGRAENSRSLDIMMFDLYPAARPEPMHWVRMQVVDTNGRALTATVKSNNGLWSATDGAAVLMLSGKYDEVLTFSAEGMLPGLLALTPAQVKGGRVGERVCLLPLTAGTVMPIDDRCVEALADWLLEHPRVRIAVECPKAADARAIHERMRQRGLRPDRLTHRGGTDVKRTQIRVL